MAKAIFVRMDRMGDLILNIPVDQHPLFSNISSHWFITSGLGFILENSHPKREYSEFNRDFSIKNCLKFILALKKLSPEFIFIFHAPWWVSLCAFLALIPIRVGRRSHRRVFWPR